MKRYVGSLLQTLVGLTTLLALAATLVGQTGPIKKDAGSSVVVFASGGGTKVFDHKTVFLGSAQTVCLNSMYPINCPPGATLYGYPGSGWLADLSRIPGGEAVWIYAPGITGLSSPAQFNLYYFQTTFVIPGTPTAGTLYVAADDAAQVIVNGTLIGQFGSIYDPVKRGNAQSKLHKFDMTPVLVKGTNTVRIRSEDGAALPVGCEVPDNYACNPAGVVYGGFAKW